MSLQRHIRVERKSTVVIIFFFQNCWTASRLQRAFSGRMVVIIIWFLRSVVSETLGFRIHKIRSLLRHIHCVMHWLFCLLFFGCCWQFVFLSLNCLIARSSFEKLYLLFTWFLLACYIHIPKMVAPTFELCSGIVTDHEHYFKYKIYSLSSTV